LSVQREQELNKSVRLQQRERAPEWIRQADERLPEEKIRSAAPEKENSAEQ
jgi:hypothetical protein